MRILRRISEQNERFERIHHRRENGTEAILAVETGEHPVLGAPQGMPPKSRRNGAIQAAADPIQTQKDTRQSAGAPGSTEIVAFPFGRSGKQLPHVYVTGI